MKRWIWLAVLPYVITWTAQYENKDCIKGTRYNQYSGEREVYLDCSHIRKMRKEFKTQDAVAEFVNGMPNQFTRLGHDLKRMADRQGLFAYSYENPVFIRDIKIYREGKIVYEENLAPPSLFFHHSFAAKSEQERLEDWLKKNGAEEVFIHPNPQVDKLKEHHWERTPFSWRGNQVWIKRKPMRDTSA